MSQGTRRSWRGVECHSLCQYRAREVTGDHAAVSLPLEQLQLDPVPSLPTALTSLLPRAQFSSWKTHLKNQPAKKVVFLTWISSLALSLTPAAQTLVLVQLQESSLSDCALITFLQNLLCIWDMFLSASWITIYADEKETSNSVAAVSCLLVHKKARRHTKKEDPSPWFQMYNITHFKKAKCTICFFFKKKLSDCQQPNVDFMQGSLYVQQYCCYLQYINDTLIKIRNAYIEWVPLLQLLLVY